MQPAAIVKLVIERIGPDNFRNAMEAVFQRNTEGARKNWSAFVRLLREQATLMGSCGVTNGKSRNEPKAAARKRPKGADPPVQETGTSEAVVGIETSRRRRKMLKLQSRPGATSRRRIV
jgi:hypothetical protein